MQETIFWNIIGFTVTLLVIPGHPDNYLNSFTSQPMKGQFALYNHRLSGTLESCARKCEHALHLSCTSFMFDCGYNLCSADQSGECFFVNDVIKTRNGRNISSVDYMRKYVYRPSTWLCNGHRSSSPSLSVIVSPFFPRIIRHRRTCSSTIRTKQIIQLSVHTWLGSEHSCRNSRGYLEIVYGKDGRESTERLCPDKFPYFIRSPGNTMSIRMKELGPVVFKAIYISVAADDCGNFKCENGGTCMAAGGELFCLCAESYTGAYCEVSLLSCQQKGCENNSSCTLLSNNETVCICDTGFEGERCESRTHYICDDRKCGHGTCRLNMEEETLNTPMSYNTSTNIEEFDAYFCECDSGYTGRRCQYKMEDCVYDPCRVSKCMTNNYTYICVCPLCHFGFCISGNRDYYCMCFPGYTGEHCTINIDECSNNPCGDHGTCIDYVNAYKCMCEPYYAGDHCEKCISNSCSDRIHYPMIIMNHVSTTKYQDYSSVSSSGLRTSTVPYADIKRVNYSKDSKNSALKLQLLESKVSLIGCMGKQLLDSICSCESFICNSTSLVTRTHCESTCMKDMFNSCGREHFCVSESCWIWWLYFSVYVQGIFSECAYNRNKVTATSSANRQVISSFDTLSCIRHSYDKGINLKSLGLIDFKQDCHFDEKDLPSNLSCLMSSANVFTPYKKCELDYFHVCVERLLPLGEDKLLNIVIYNISNIEMHFKTQNLIRFQLCMKNVNFNGEEDVDICTSAEGTFGCVLNMSICATTPCIHGYCQDNVNGTDYTCICEQGYSGRNCTIAAENSAAEESCSLKTRLVAAIYVLVVLLVLQTFITVVICSCRGHRQKKRGSVNLDNLVFPECDDEPRYLYSKYSFSEDETSVIKSLREHNYRNMWNVTQIISGVELGKSEA